MCAEGFHRCRSFLEAACLEAGPFYWCECCIYRGVYFYLDGPSKGRRSPTLTCEVRCTEFLWAKCPHMCRKGGARTASRKWSDEMQTLNFNWQFFQRWFMSLVICLGFTGKRAGSSPAAAPFSSLETCFNYPCSAAAGISFPLSWCICWLLQTVGKNPVVHYFCRDWKGTLCGWTILAFHSTLTNSK